MITASRVTFRKFWLRESPPHPIVPEFEGSIDPDYPVEVDWDIDGAEFPRRVSVSVSGEPRARMEDLPFDPAAAGRKAARRSWAAGLVAESAGSGSARNGSVPLELLWPCLDRRGAAQPRLAMSPPRVTEDGAIYLQDPGLHQARSMAALAILFRGGRVDAPFHLRFSDIRTMAQRPALFQLPLILDRYGIGGSWRDWIEARPGHNFDVSILLRLKADAAQGWVESPGPRQAAFYDRLIRVANAVQSSLRVWFNYIYFLDFRTFSDTQRSWPMAVFNAMKPFRSKSRADYTYEVTDAASIQKALWGVIPSLEAEMRRITPRLSTLSLEIQRDFSQRRASEMVKEMERVPRAFGSLLFAEREIIEAFLRFAQRLHEAIQVGKPDGVVKHGTVLHGKVERRLGTVYPTYGFGTLAPVLLLEATSAMAEAAGYSFPIEAMVRIRDREEGADYYGANSFFTG